MTFAVERNPSPLADSEREAILAAPGFGKYFTDHMFRADWTADGGWTEGAIVPYQPLSLDPATMALHYGQLIFEGLKAYAQPDGSIATFRPERNAARMQRSSQRLAMVEVPTELFVDSLDALVQVDRAWVPTAEDESLYLRPFLVATEIGLGVNKGAQAYSFFVIASPAGPYFAGGIKPVTVWLSTTYTRAAPGGTGEAKCAGNYAASFAGQKEALANGCDQVVWLDANEHRWVEEMGGMNLYFVFGSGPGARLVTPALTGTLLPGVTRDSLLQIGADHGYQVEEGKLSTDEWQAGCESGQISEVFACGTAAVITPVGAVKSASANWTIGDGQPGPISLELRKALTDIQTGKAPDTHGWMHKLA